jgi:hypothetical protein
MVPVPTVNYGSDSANLLNYGSGTNSTYPLLKDGDALVFEWFAELHDLFNGKRQSVTKILKF